MCGIVGAVAQRNVTTILMEGLKRLEYRGYDSAGIAVIDNSNQQINCLRTKGKVDQLVHKLTTSPLAGTTGIAHTRWATHGVPSTSNAHPHMSGHDFAIVHNGIIENHAELKKMLTKAGFTFNSDTDSEVIAHLVAHHFHQSANLLKAVQATCELLQGAYAFGVLHNNDPERMIAVRFGSPLVVGIGDQEHFIASDPLALLPVTQQFIYLEEGDIVDLKQDGVDVYDDQLNKVARTINASQLDDEAVSMGDFPHHMLKEIYEQPQAVSAAIYARLTEIGVSKNTFGAKATKILEAIKHVQIVACGTSYHSGLVAQYWLEAIAGVSCRVEIASEFRYRQHVVYPNTLFLTMSQSGETADSIAALRQAKQAGFATTFTVCNVPESTLVRESDITLMTNAGAEIGVASTKAFTTQLAALLILTLTIVDGRITPEKRAHIIAEMLKLPQQIKTVLKLDPCIKDLAQVFVKENHAIFLGRGTQYPIALEGALKLKEISYVHAEAFAAGELKHGPLALVDENMWVVTVAPDDEVLDKIKSNLAEVRARGGKLIIFAPLSAQFKSEPGVHVINMPNIDPLTAPIIYTIPLQLLAYHAAVLRGTDVDKPRNLAKSVTVE